MLLVLNKKKLQLDSMGLKLFTEAQITFQRNQQHYQVLTLVSPDCGVRVQ